MTQKAKKPIKCLIIGSGPAGCTAAIYAARAAMEPVLVRGTQPGGQLMVTTDVENYPGFRSVIQGPWLMQEMEAQAAAVGTTLVSDVITSVDFSNKHMFKAEGERDIYQAQTVILATGSRARWLGIPSEERFRGYGVSACATCDAFFCKNKVVVVVGGGNTAVEEALYLTHFARKVYLVHRRDSLRCEKILQARLMKAVDEGKVEIVWNHVIEEILGEEEDGDKFVHHVVLKNTQTHALIKKKVEAVFIAIGHDPVTGFLNHQVVCDETGYIAIGNNPDYKMATSVEGVFAAGDVADHTYRQAVTAAAMGCMAALEAERYWASNFS